MCIRKKHQVKQLLFYYYHYFKSSLRLKERDFFVADNMTS